MARLTAVGTGIFSLWPAPAGAALLPAGPARSPLLPCPLSPRPAGAARKQPAHPSSLTMRRPARPRAPSWQQAEAAAYAAVLFGAAVLALAILWPVLAHLRAVGPLVFLGAL